jgi:hypothetical protein
MQPQKYLSDNIEKANKLFLSLSTIQELKEAFDFYSDKCSDLDSIEVIMKLPEYFIQISGKLLSADTSARHVISIDLASLSWNLLQNRKYKTSLNAIQLALAADSNNSHVYITLPLALILNDRFDEARNIYLKYYRDYVFKTWGKSYQKIFLDDITDLENRGIEHPDFARVKKLLKK